MSEEQVTKSEEKKCNCCVFKVLSVIALLLSIAALTMSILTYSGNAPSIGAQSGPVKISTQYDKGKSLEKALKTNKHVIVFFYTDWCHFCQQFVKTYDAVAKDKQIKKDFAIAYVNCEDKANEQLMAEYQVDAFPTVFVINKDTKNKTKLDNATFYNTDSKDVIIKNALAAINEPDAQEQTPAE